ncbi:MAG: STAS domain-containing protein, partial [Planctomycetes bacterium]|nr:STAS domain-containing protein [Planctomycetota bacterium]
MRRPAGRAAGLRGQGRAARRHHHPGPRLARGPAPRPAGLNDAGVTVHIEIEDLQDISIVTVHEPRLDALVASELRNRLMALAERGCTRLALDVSRVDFMDSSGLGVLVALLRRLGRPQALALWGPTPAVERMLR